MEEAGNVHVDYWRLTCCVASFFPVDLTLSHVTAGTNSYVLFTLDKLIYKLVKQFQAILADELGQVDTCSFPLFL